MKKIRSFFLIFFIFSFFLSAQPNAPEWAKGIVWYQIFPERFANGDESNDPHPEKVFINRDKIPEDWEITPWTNNWFAQQEWEKKLGGNFRNHLYSRRYGGDIQGIIDRLDYLKELGVGAIYLNPVFEAVSLHKYDGSTFHHIDVNFGPDPKGDIELISKEIPDDPSTWVWTSADKLFLKLIEEVHARGMRIIIDGVFNHVGEQFWAFQDVVENQEESIYKDWFLIKSFDDPSTEKNEFDYKGWWNIKSLPEFNRTDNDLHHGPKQYVFHATERWMDPNGDGKTDDGIDGWRLDVARDVPLGFWKDWNKLVKSINNEAILIGELWELSPDFISQDGAFDALMNYNFAYAVKELFIDQKKKIDVNTFRKKLKEIDETYPEEFLHVLQNLMGSHDTERLSSLILNPDKDYDRDGNEDNPNYNPGKPTENEYEIQKLVAAFQMSYRGAPMIYYGDEVGMWGADDPHDRKPMVWSDLDYDDEVINKTSGFSKGFGTYAVEQNEDLLNYYKKIISIRNGSDALKKGDVNFLYSNDDMLSFAFERNFNNEKVIAAFNLGNELDSISLTLDLNNFNFVEMIENGEGSVVSGEVTTNFKIQIPAKSVRVYKIYSN
jgi:cyclomaltodextrinase / maltogenic alpha-amylase / neopullulanase